MEPRGESRQQRRAKVVGIATYRCGTVIYRPKCIAGGAEPMEALQMDNTPRAEIGTVRILRYRAVP